MVLKVNKKGQFALAGLSVGVVIVLAVGILILAVLGYFGLSSFITSNLWTIIGVTGIILTFVYAVPTALTGKFSKEKIGFVLALMFIFVLLIFVPKLGITQTVFNTPSEFVNDVSLTTEKSINLDFCSNLPECIADLKNEGMPDNYLVDNGITITCSSSGKCVMQRA
jgi:hypothetical protein